MEKIKEPSQCQRIKAELEMGRALTSIDILNMNILNYKGRISDLRRSGLDIDTTMVATKGGSRIARYSLRKNLKPNTHEFS